LMMYDSKTNQVTKQPAVTYGRWMQFDHLLKKPIISFDDLDQDGHNELVFEEREHNGTTTNYVNYIYYSIDATLALNPIFALDTRWIDLQTNEKSLVVRRLEKQKPGIFKIETALQMPNQQDQKLGESIWEQQKPNSQFKIKSWKILIPAYESYINEAILEDED